MLRDLHATVHGGSTGSGLVEKVRDHERILQGTKHEMGLIEMVRTVWADRLSLRAQLAIAIFVSPPLAAIITAIWVNR